VLLDYKNRSYNCGFDFSALDLPRWYRIVRMRSQLISVQSIVYGILLISYTYTVLI
jgi:hypothetical protein